MPYLSLDANQLTTTVVRLRQRIEERFPGSGLASVGGELVGLSEKARDSIHDLTKPIIGLRIASGSLLVLILLGLVVTVISLTGENLQLTFVDFVQVLEAGINDLILIGLGIFFLVSLERRIKRRRILSAIHELRSIAHIVDMHQLTKDPSHVLRHVEDTESSPQRELGGMALERYLDYCSEMLSLTGKIAALYVQEYDDAVVLAAVNEVEALTTGLSGKIWQKMMILETLADSD